MRKLTSLLRIMLLFSLSACTSPSNWYTADVCFNGYANDQGYWDFALNDKGTSFMPVYKIETLRELADFKTNLQPYFSFNGKKTNTASFNEVTADCDDTFFSANTLLIVYIVSGSGTYRFRVPDIRIQDGALTVFVEQYNDEGVHTCDMSGWLAVIQIPKAKLADVTEYRAQETP